jgi:hypothetical protein
MNSFETVAPTIAYEIALQPVSQQNCPHITTQAKCDRNYDCKETITIVLQLPNV